jgi:HTH-type transcriptional regulator, sugar sensing transcriptional regulator
VFKTLAGFGLTPTEAKVYVYLAMEGPQNAKTAAKSLSLSPRLILRILDSLQEKEIVNKISEKEVIFSAMPFDMVIDLLVKMHLEETNIIEQKRDEILSHWKSLIKRDFAT